LCYCTSDVGEVIDLVFAIEGTKRMKEDGFEEAKDFIKNMVRDNYTISKLGTHVGIVEYSDEPSMKLRLNHTFVENLINNLVDEMTPSEGESGNLDKALEKSVDKMFSVALGGRPSAKKILVVIAASNTTGKEALKKAAKPLKERGVRIYVIALDDADPEVLSELVPDKKIKKVKDKKKLPKLNEDLSKLIEDDLIESKLNLRWLFFLSFSIS
jgi:hypothetical protein